MKRAGEKRIVDKTPMERRLTIRNSDGTVSQPTDMKWAEALNKLAAYEDAEEQGRMVVLPCKIGDEVYRPLYGKIWEGTVLYFSIDKDRIFASIQNVNGGAFVFEYAEDFGKTVFLTREEAKKVLEGMK